MCILNWNSVLDKLAKLEANKANLHSDETEVSCDVTNLIYRETLRLIPEREDELKYLFNKYSPKINILVDGLTDDSFVLDACISPKSEKSTRDIRFGERTIWAYLMAISAAWEGYWIEHNNGPTDRLQDLLQNIKNLYNAIHEELDELDPETHFADQSAKHKSIKDILINYQPIVFDDIENLAVTELTIIAVLWCILHELRHIMIKQDSISVTSEGEETFYNEQQQVEFDCDRYATCFIIDKVANYSSNADENNKAIAKRQTGIILGIFSVMVLDWARGLGWHASDTHPSVSDRIDRIISLLGIDKKKASDFEGSPVLAALAAFLGLNRVLNDSPYPRNLWNESDE